MLDPMCKMEMTGPALLAALENGVSQWPKLEGRFPQVRSSGALRLHA